MDLSEPLAKTRHGDPLLYGCYFAYFQLESFPLDGGADFAGALEPLSEALSPNLKWSFSHLHGEVTPYQRGDWRLLSEFPALLAAPPPHPDPDLNQAQRRMQADRLDRYGVCFHGGSARNLPSPWSARFFGGILEVGTGEAFPSRSALMFSMPSETPLEAFSALCRGLAAGLPLRWGAAGFGYSGWELDRYGDTRQAIYAHARRHPGFDMGQHASLLGVLHHKLRTINWLTWLNPDFADKVAPALEALKNDPQINLGQCGPQLELMAGPKPLPGHTNRGDIPLPYQRVAGALEPLLAAGDTHFFAPWTEATTHQWLTRFLGPRRD